MSSLYRWARIAAAMLAAAMLLTSMSAALAEEVSAAEEAAVVEAKSFELNGAGEYVSVNHTLSIGSSTTYTINVRDTLDVSFNAGAIKSFESKKPRVADVVVVDNAGGTAQILACGEGTAKLKAKLANGKKVSLKLVVKDPAIPERVSLGGETIAMNVGEALTLSPTLYPATAQTTCKWSSSKAKVASVSEDGVVTALREGKAKITVKTANGKKCSVAVKVTDACKPESVRLSDAAVSVGEAVALTPELTPANAVTTFTWSSGNKKVATVSGDGMVTGVKAGSVKITARTANGKKAVCTVTVQEGGSVVPSGNAKYRALLVANDNFYMGDELGWEKSTYNQRAANQVKDMLKKVSGPDGGGYAVTVKKNVTRSALKSAIASAFSGANENDVSLFYFASHGDSFSSDSYAGALAMASVTEEPAEYVRLTELRDWLSEVPGRVIVLLDTCGSGAAVYKKGAADWSAARSACERFDAEAIRAFSEADRMAETVVAKTGELRVSNKFFVLCSSRYREESWAYEDEKGGGSFFTDWLVEGVGRSGSMPADARYGGNANGAVDLHELFKYISAVGDSYAVSYCGDDYYQHVQVYPADTRFEMFR